MAAEKEISRVIVDDATFNELGSAPATPSAGKARLYRKTDGKFYGVGSDGIESPIGSGGSVDLITQNAHGFVAADVGRPVYLNGALFALAKADAANTAEISGVLSRIIDTNKFEVTTGGKVTGILASVFQEGTLPAASDVLFLSKTVAGKWTVTEPNTIGDISKPGALCAYNAGGSVDIYFFNMRGSVVGGVNARASVALANNAVTNVQDLSAYDSATIEGHLFVDGTADTRSFYKIHVIKKGDGTFEIATDRIGDDVGETVAITSAGILRITLPSIAGFVSANFVYTLGAPQVGATFPLSVSGTNITDQKTVQTYTTSGAISSAPSAVQHIFNSASALAMTLGSAVGVNGSRIHLKNVNTGLVTITFNGAETCEGNANITLVQWEFAVLEAFNNNWIIVG